MKLTYAITFVSDMAQSVAFYRDIIGLPLQFESPEWTEFASEGATLALHKPESETEGYDGNPKAAGRCRPGFSVQNLDVFHQRMLDAGVPCIQEPHDICSARIAQYSDPDGLVITVSGV